MKAGVFYSKNDLRVEEIPKPSPKSGEVLIKVKACRYCFGPRIFRHSRVCRRG